MLVEYWFRSTQFKLITDEEKSTNPGCLGKSLAEWLAIELIKLGYQTEVIAEDFGWCVMCEKADYLLWIGCGGVLPNENKEQTSDNPPMIENITWHVFTKIEIPFYMIKSHIKKFLGKLDTETPINDLNNRLEEILHKNKTILFCKEI